MRRAVALPSMSCSLPECDRTRSNGRLRVLTNPDKNTTTRVWMSYLRFDLSGLGVHAGARLVDAELLLFGTAKCHGALNFTQDCPAATAVAALKRSTWPCTNIVMCQTSQGWTCAALCTQSYGFIKA